MEVSNWNLIQRKLTNEARRFLMEAYGIELHIPIKLNGRLKTRLGAFYFRTDRKESLSIEISKTFILYNDQSTVFDTLIHECIHYALYELDRPFKDGHPVFEAELKKHGSHSTGTVPYKGRVVEYACSRDDCPTVFRKKKRYPRNGEGYRCGVCGSPIKFIGEKIV